MGRDAEFWSANERGVKNGYCLFSITDLEVLIWINEWISGSMTVIAQLNRHLLRAWIKLWYLLLVERNCSVLHGHTFVPRRTSAVRRFARPRDAADSNGHAIAAALPEAAASGSAARAHGVGRAPPGRPVPRVNRPKSGRSCFSEDSKRAAGMSSLLRCAPVNETCDWLAA
jgi:hypothetical protein